MLVSERQTAAQRLKTPSHDTSAAGSRLCLLCAFLLAMYVPAGATQQLPVTTASIKLGEPLRANFALPRQETGECVQAQVSYGEEPVPGHLVRASISGGQQNRYIRVQADAAVHEPFVTVALRTGCKAPRVSVHTLLPEPVDGFTFASAPRAAKRPLQSVAPPSERLGESGPAREPKAQTRPAADRGENRPRFVNASKLPGAGSRLTVVPWEDSHPQARSSSARLSAPSPDPQVRATATLMRAAVFQPVEQSANAFSQADRLEATLALLLERERRRSSDIAELRSELAQVGSWPVSAWIAASVVLILSAATVAAALLVPTAARPRRRSSGWQPAVPTGLRSLRPRAQVVPSRQDGSPSSGPLQPVVPRDDGERQGASVEHLLAARLRELDASLDEEPLRTDAKAASALASAATEHGAGRSSGPSTRPSAFEFGPRLGFDIDLDDMEREVSAAR